MARQERKYNYIYKITCKVTNRYYIGMHSTDNLDDGYFGSGKRLWFSINYHGKENHDKEILEFLPNREELKKREKEIVTKELIKEDLCMNLCVGGEGGRGFTSEEQKKNVIKANAKMKSLAETNPEWVEKRRVSFSNARKREFEEGTREPIKYDWTGKHHSDDAKKKIGNANSIKQSGKSNSHFGTCWIMKGGLNKKIKKEDLETFLKEGWVKGRIKYGV